MRTELKIFEQIRIGGTGEESTGWRGGHRSAR